MPPIKGQMFRYSETDMQEALEDCKRGVPTATAAKIHGVPRVTLLYKFKGKTPIKRQMGRNCYLSEEVEAMLGTWVKCVAKMGFPITKDQLLDSVKKLVDDLKIDTPFINGRPGKRWYCSFLKRHPDLIIRTSQNLTSTRAAVTKSQLKKWFEEVLCYLNENNFDSILKDPHRIFNMDETAFFLNPKGNKVLAAKGEKSVYQQVNSDEKECLTVLFGGNAVGDIIPPMVIFKYERIPRELSLSVPEFWGIGRSDNGWMTGETFYEYITNIFNTWLEETKIPKPVILFMDGHTSHLTLQVSKFCSENGIILVALYPNATHLLQPMDVAIFRSLKGAWKSAVHQWRVENIDSPTLRKTHFCPLLKKVITNTLVPTIFQNGFRKCGLFPWNPDAVCCDDKLNKTSITEHLAQNKEIKELEAGINFMEKYVDNRKIMAFKNCDEWLGVKEDLALFQFYKNTESLLKQKKDDLASKSVIDQPLQESRNSNVSVLEDNVHESILARVNESPIQIILPDVCEFIDVDPKTPNKQNESNNLQIIQNNEQNMEKNIDISVPPTNPTLPSTSNLIPSPFKRALFWPAPKQNMKKRKKEKIPAVISSIKWQKYHENKDNKKAAIDEEKKRRAEERKKKKELNEEIKKQKLINKTNKTNIKNIKKKTKKTDYNSDTSTDEEWVDSGDSIDDIETDKDSEETDKDNER